MRVEQGRWAKRRRKGGIHGTRWGWEKIEQKKGHAEGKGWGVEEAAWAVVREQEHVPCAEYFFGMARGHKTFVLGAEIQDCVLDEVARPPESAGAVSRGGSVQASWGDEGKSCIRRFPASYAGAKSNLRRVEDFRIRSRIPNPARPLCHKLTPRSLACSSLPPLTRTPVASAARSPPATPPPPDMAPRTYISRPLR